MIENKVGMVVRRMQPAFDARILGGKRLSYDRFSGGTVCVCRCSRDIAFLSQTLLQVAVSLSHVATQDVSAARLVGGQVEWAARS